MWLKIPKLTGFIPHYLNSRMYPAPSNSAGFTLIELLVAMSITMVIGGLLLANYTKYNKNQQLKQVALTLKTNLRLAQNKATTGQKPASGCTELTGYTISFSVNSYEAQATCTPEGLAGDMTKVTFPIGISFSPVPSSITFGVLTKGVASDVTMTLTNGSKNYAISIMRSGDMNDLGFQ